MKKVKAMLLAALSLVCVFAGCSSQPTNNEPANTSSTINATSINDDTSSDEKDKQIVIGFSINAYDEFQSEWVQIMQEKCDEAGVKAIFTNADGKPDKQLSDVEALIEQKPDVISIKAVDFDAAIPCFEACKEAGIPTIDEMGIDYNDTHHIVSNQYDFGITQNEWLVNYLKENPDFKLKVGYIWGALGFATLNERYDAFVDGLLNEFPDQVEIIAEKTANWTSTEAMALTEDWLQAFPEINCIYAQSDEMAIGAINALKGANVNFDDYIVVGFDGSPNAQTHIRDGSMKSTVFYAKKESCRVTLEHAIQLANGETSLIGQTYDLTKEVGFNMDANNIDEILEKYAYKKS